MQIKSVLIYNIHYLNFITFNISTFSFFLICPTEIVKYSNSSFFIFKNKAWTKDPEKKY